MEQKVTELEAQVNQFNILVRYGLILILSILSAYLILTLLDTEKMKMMDELSR